VDLVSDRAVDAGSHIVIGRLQGTTWFGLESQSEAEDLVADLVWECEEMRLLIARRCDLRECGRGPLLYCGYPVDLPFYAASVKLRLGNHGKWRHGQRSLRIHRGFEKINRCDALARGTDLDEVHASFKETSTLLEATSSSYITVSWSKIMQSVKGYMISARICHGYVYSALAVVTTWLVVQMFEISDSQSVVRLPLQLKMM